MLGLKITREPRPPRAPRLPRIAWRVAGWNPALTAGIVVFIFLIAHEATYHLAGGDEYPLEAFANGTRVFAMSHGGLDTFGGGMLAVAVLLLIDRARKHARRPT